MESPGSSCVARTCPRSSFHRPSGLHARHPVFDAQRLVWTFNVVKRKVLRQPNQQFTRGGVAVEVKILVFDIAHSRSS